MAVIVGTDSYIDVDTAAAYIQKYYLPTDAKSIAWAALTADNKAVYLRRATASIDAIAWAGQKYDNDQELQFPRVFDVGGGYCRARTISRFQLPSPPLWSIQTEIPEAVKAACIEEAMELCSPSSDTTDSEARAGAVASYSIGSSSLSETFRGPSMRERYLSGAIKSSKARQLLTQYTGGAGVC